MEVSMKRSLEEFSEFADFLISGCDRALIFQEDAIGIFPDKSKLTICYTDYIARPLHYGGMRKKDYEKYPDFSKFADFFIEVCNQAIILKREVVGVYQEFIFCIDHVGEKNHILKCTYFEYLNGDDPKWKEHFGSGTVHFDLNGGTIYYDYYDNDAECYDNYDDSFYLNSIY
jgi:hypothetical protein